MINNQLEEQFIDIKTFIKVVASLEQRIEANSMRIEAYQNSPVAENKVLSFKELIKKIFSLNPFSRPFDAKKIFKTILWLVIMVPLFVSCMLLVYDNYQAYMLNEVVTQIKTKESNNLTFPAVTFCVFELAQGKPSVIYNLSEVFQKCMFEGHIDMCSENDFEYVLIYDASVGASYDCFKVNGGRNATNQKTAILNALSFGKGSGFSFHLQLKNVVSSVGYYVGDTGVKPVFGEMTNLLQPGKVANVAIKKSVDAKLPEPYNDCEDDIDGERSYLVKDILDQNITYRQINCYDLCFYNYQRSPRKSPTRFNYKDSNCTQLCPNECITNSFEVTETLSSLTDNQNSTHVDYKRLLIINVFYANNKYVDISQSVKTTTTDLIANIGGVLGLFLEVTFISAYRFFIIIFDIIF